MPVAARAATSAIVTSTRRGEATSKAPVAVTESRTTPISSVSQRRCRASATSPSRPDPADLGGDKAGVGERLFADLIPEPFAAHPRQSGVAFHVRVALRCERGEDLLEADSRHHSIHAFAVCGAMRDKRRTRWKVFDRKATSQTRVALQHLPSHPFGVGAGRQVGTGEEHLAAAARDRHEAVQGYRVAQRPWSDDDEDSDDQNCRLDKTEAPAITSAPGKYDDGDREREGQILGPRQCQGSEQQSRDEPFGTPLPVGRPEHREHRAG